MAFFIKASNIAVAWLSAMRYLWNQDGTAVNLLVVAEHGDEDPHLRHCLDTFLDGIHAKHKDVLPVETVANTIFPKNLYQVAGSAEELFELHAIARQVRDRLKEKEEYFDRLVSWRGSAGPVNQLKDVIKKLRTVSHLSSAYELALSSPEDQHEQGALDLRIFDPQRDHRIMGFPCLSHVSLTIKDSKLHLTALYRNQHFLRKAYGNYLGLASLASFLAEQSGFGVGELAVVATHADLEIRTFTKKAVGRLIEECEATLVGDVAAQMSPVVVEH